MNQSSTSTNPLMETAPFLAADPCSLHLAGLRDVHGACALKLSTEDAGMGFEQIAFWTGRCQGLLPVLVKIGGPNARNDIKQLVARGVDGLIAPMVESAYGLENFIEAVRECSPQDRYPSLKKQINIETRTSVEQLDEILACPQAAELDEITIGCSDLSRSLRQGVTDPATLRLVERCVDTIRGHGYSVSIGGGITPGNIDSRLRRLNPVKFNTRVVTFRVRSGLRYAQAVRTALEFERMMLSLDQQEGFLSADEAGRRIRELNIRLA